MKIIISAMLAISMLLMGDLSAKAVTNDTDSNNPPVSLYVSGMKPSAAASTVPVTVTSSKPVFDTKEIKGKVKNIFYAEANKVIISADKIYLYDLSKGKTLAEADLPITAVNSVQSIKNGYVVIGENNPRSPSNGAKCAFYDKNLKFISTVVIGDIHQTDRRPPFSEEIAVSDDGGKIAFPISYEGLYIYDISKKQKNLLISTNSENPNGIAGITKIRFTNSDKSIAFQASSFDLPLVYGKDCFSTCGVINIDGTGLINTKTGDYSIYEMTNSYDGFALFAEDFRSPTGRFLRMDTKSGKTQFLKSSKKKETSYVVGSDNGKYYATAMLGKTTCTVRIYETETGNLVSEQEAVFIEELYSFRAPSVKVIDATKTCIILLGNTQSDEYPTKVFVSQF